MKGHTFIEEERAMLLKRKHVAKVTAHTVSFTPAFKKFAVEENVEKGRRPTRHLHHRRHPRTRNRKHNTREDRQFVENDGRGRQKVRGGRKKKDHVDESTMGDKEIIAYYKTKCVYTEAENAFLVRTRGIPRMAPFVYHLGSNMDL